MATEAELEARMETLAETRDYARSVLHHSYEEVVQGCTQALSLYGFWCVPSLLLRRAGMGWLALTPAPQRHRPRHPAGGRRGCAGFH